MQTVSNLLGLAVVILLCFGGPVTYLGYRDLRTRERSTEIPREATAAEFYAAGPGDNLHLRLRGFRFGPTFYHDDFGGEWDTVWVPLYPVGNSQEGPPKLLLRLDDVKEQEQLAELAERESVTGMLSPSVGGLALDDPDRHPGMKELWPGVDWGRMVVLGEGRSHPSAGWAYGQFWSGIAALVLAVICFIVGVRLTKERPPWEWLFRR